MQCSKPVPFCYCFSCVEVFLAKPPGSKIKHPAFRGKQWKIKHVVKLMLTKRAACQDTQSAFRFCFIFTLTSKEEGTARHVGRYRHSWTSTAKSEQIFTNWVLRKEWQLLWGWWIHSWWVQKRWSRWNWKKWMCVLLVTCPVIELNTVWINR